MQQRRGRHEQLGVLIGENGRRLLAILVHGCDHLGQQQWGAEGGVAAGPGEVGVGVSFKPEGGGGGTGGKVGGANFRVTPIFDEG